MNKHSKFSRIFPIISLLFPCILGVIAMIAHHISPAIWGLHLGSACLLALLSFLCINRNYPLLSFSQWIGAVCLLLLVFTFADPGMEGVHRWIRIGSFTVNAAMISIPALIAVLFQMLIRKQVLPALAISTATVLLLFFQPDASQLTAFCIPAVLMIVKQDRYPRLRFTFCIFACLLTILSWIQKDPLLPVDYTEGILQLLGHLSLPLWILGILSLFLLPLPFVLLSASENRLLMTGIALYYWLMVLSSFFGSFPVPVMGYGVSPVIGYFIFYILSASRRP